MPGRDDDRKGSLRHLSFGDLPREALRLGIVGRRGGDQQLAERGLETGGEKDLAPS